MDFLCAVRCRYETLSGIKGFSMVGSARHWFLSSGHPWAIGVIVTKVLDATGGVSLSALCCEFNDTLLIVIVKGS